MQYKFFRKETNQWEVVEAELWQWEAYYLDGKILKQFDDEYVFHQIREIDQLKLHVFKVVNSKNGQTFTIVWGQNKKPIYFYRHIILNAGTPYETRVKAYCFGYEYKNLGKTHKVIMMITPNNELVVTDNPDLVEIG